MGDEKFKVISMDDKSDMSSSRLRLINQITPMSSSEDWDHVNYILSKLVELRSEQVWTGEDPFPVNRETDRQTHMTENITLPQLRWRAAKSSGMRGD